MMDEAKEQSVWVTGLRQISVPLEDKIKNIEKLESLKRTKLLTDPIMDLKFFYFIKRIYREIWVL